MQSVEWRLQNCNINCRLLLSVEDTVHVTKEHRPANLLFSLFSLVFCSFVTYSVRGMTSTPSKSATILYDETVPICLLTKFQSYTGKYLYTYIQVRL